MRSLLVATAFLTRVPIPVHATADDVRAATRWFPAVGAVIGMAAAAIARLLMELPALPSTLGAVLLVTLGAWVTGAIHLDGLADMADGFGGGRTKDDVLRIMRDPRVGTFGALVLILLTAAKITAIATLLDRRATGPFLIVAPVLSRWTIVAIGTWLPYARAEGGLGEAATRNHDVAGLLWATALTAAIAFGAAGPRVVVLWITAAIVSVAVARAARARIGGVTGDVFGASVELSETAVLIGAVLLTGGR